MEPRFGHDFGHVRVHADAKAAESARAVNALAYTVGHDIAFATGKYQPSSNEGRGLMAHELAHVVQQRDAVQTQTNFRIASPATPEEHQAENAASKLTKGDSVSIRPNRGQRLIQRQLCGGQPLPPCKGTYESIPSNSGIGNSVGEWIGLQYKREHPIDSYLLVDHRLYFRGEKLSKDDLSQRTSATGTPRAGLDPPVYTALQTGEFFEVLRPDILDSDRDDLYEIKPIRGAGAGPAQLGDYITRLNQFAVTAPQWMGSRRRNWKAGPWQPKLQLDVGSAIVCVYPNAAAGILLYDILQCRREGEQREPHPQPPLAFDWSGETTDNTKSPTDTKGKSNGKPGKGNGRPGKGDRPGHDQPQPALRLPSGPILDKVIAALLIIGTYIAIRTFWGRIGALLGMLARAAGITLGIGAASATAAGAGQKIPVPVPVPSGTSSTPAGSPGSRQQTGTSKQKESAKSGVGAQKVASRDAVHVSVIEGLNAERVAVGNIVPVQFTNGVAILQVTRVTKEQSVTTVEFASLQEGWYKPEQMVRTLGGNKAYVLTVPFDPRTQTAGLRGYLMYTGKENRDWLLRYLENLAKELEASGQNELASHVHNELQRLH